MAISRVERSRRRWRLTLSCAVGGMLVAVLAGCGEESPPRPASLRQISAPPTDVGKPAAPKDSAEGATNASTAKAGGSPTTTASSADISSHEPPPTKSADLPQTPEDQERAFLDDIFAHRKNRAPSLEGGVGWINAAGPIDLKELRGKFVVIDFWTFCCINCMHIIPELKQLEKEYPDNLVVIGVHSAKFEAEQDSKNITDAVLRYEIEHPVVNDAHQKIWERFGVESWPTIVLIDPEGYILSQDGGEVKAAAFEAFFKKFIPYYRKKGLLDERPIHFDLARSHATQTPLRYPGKILADEPGGRLFISDSNHNRIVVTRLDGQLLDTIGSGDNGHSDGDFQSAQFNRPQGMALAGDTLYVADTENHLLRKIDLKQKQVATIAGTGRQADSGWPGWSMADRLPFDIGDEQKPQRFVGPPRSTAISSPWDLLIHGKDLFIAMAGTHQIWKMPLDESEIGPYAGNSREDIVDGPLLPPQPFLRGFASFAQPSGLASDGTSLFVADSEASSIRAVPFVAGGEVRTLVGTANLVNGRLFTFGDVDGERFDVRLQHPLGVAYHNGSVYVADTYNNKIKLLDPVKQTCRGLAGSGQPGHDDAIAGAAATATFDEPTGLCYAAGKLYVADTNNHLIRTIDLDHGLQVATLQIPALAPPAPPKVVAAPDKPSFKDAEQVKLPEATVKPADGAIHLAVKFTLPAGYEINPLAPMRYLLEGEGPAGPIDRDALGKLQPLDHPAAEFDIKVPIKQCTGRETLKLSMTYYYCEDGPNGVCKIGSVTWTIPVVLSAEVSSPSLVVPLTVK